MVDDNKVTVKELPDGKWGCFLHVPGYDQPFDLGKQYEGGGTSRTLARCLTEATDRDRNGAREIPRPMKSPRNSRLMAPVASGLAGL